MNFYGRPRFIRGMANVFQATLGAFGATGNAHGASMMNDLVRVVDPFFLRNYFHQILLDIFWIVTLGQLQAA